MSEGDHTAEIPALRTVDGAVRLVGSECPACGRRAFPARRYCPDCLAEMDEWTTGADPTLETYTTIHVSADRFETPYLAGFVTVPPEGIRAFGPLVGEADDFEMGERVVPTVATVGRQPTWAFRPRTEDA